MLNEVDGLLVLRDLMDEPEGWGRVQGREVYQRLLQRVSESRA